MAKNSPAGAGDAGSIPGSGRSPGEGHGHQLQCSYLGNPTGGGPLARPCGSQKSRRRLHDSNDSIDCTCTFLSV